MPPEAYTNVVLSSNPCPDCRRANGITATMAEWKKSEYGIPGSDKRICDGNCHCVLVPEELMDEFPEIDKKSKLRGDIDTDIGKTVDVYPNEVRLQRLMDEYNARIGKLPPEIYDMPLEKIADYLDDLLKKLPPTGGVPGVPKTNIHENLTAIEKATLKKWTGKDYILMREYLSTGKIAGEGIAKGVTKKYYAMIKKESKLLETIFKKYKDGVRNKILYRGLSELDEDVYQAIKAHKRGETIKIDNTITSWTDEYDIAEGFTGGERSVIFQVKEGRVLTNEFDINRYSVHAEGETIMQNTKFKVNYVVERKIGVNKTLSIYLEETGL